MIDSIFRKLKWIFILKNEMKWKLKLQLENKYRKLTNKSWVKIKEKTNKIEKLSKKIQLNCLSNKYYQKKKNNRLNKFIYIFIINKKPTYI